MEEQNLERTNAALKELGSSIENLRHALNVKKNAFLQQKEAYKNNIQSKNAEIGMLQKAIEDAYQTVSQSAQKIVEVIEKNGTGNNSN